MFFMKKVLKLKKNSNKVAFNFFLGIYDLSKYGTARVTIAVPEARDFIQSL